MTGPSDGGHPGGRASAARVPGRLGALVVMILGLALLGGALAMFFELRTAGGEPLSWPLELTVEYVAGPLARWTSGGPPSPATLAGITRYVLYAAMVLGLVVAAFSSWSLAPRRHDRGE